MKTLFIINPTSGMDVAAPARRKLLDAVSTMSDTTAHVLTGPGEAQSIASDAARENYDRIVVCAGDGTLNEVINGIGDSGTALGIVPLGTGNVLASDLGLGQDSVERALEVVSAGSIREVDLGKAGEQRFLLMAGFGFDAEVVQSVPKRAKGLFGRLAYAPNVVRESVLYQPSEFRLILDDTTRLCIDAYNVIVCNCGSYARNLRLAPDVHVDDGVLDVLVFGNKPEMKLKFLGWLSASLVTKLAADSSALHYRAKRVRIDSNPPVKMQLDGDVRGESGVDIEVLPKALRLIVP